MELQAIFTSLLQQYTDDRTAVNTLWQEIEKHYSNKKRHYHHLGHLQQLINLLQQYRPLAADWNSMLLAVFYHDSIYHVLKNDNEEKSAALAASRLSSIGCPAEIIARCCRHILATKKHAAAEDTDTNLFTDADLSVLGQPIDVYREYCGRIRKEYAVYPDILYIPGRLKVVRHFLQMENIFKTPAFFSRFEAVAKSNLQYELEALTGSR